MFYIAVVLFIKGSVFSYALPHHYGYPDECDGAAEALAEHWHHAHPPKGSKVKFECRWSQMRAI